MWPERSLALNRTSTDIVRMLDGEHTVDDIISQLGERYTADRARIAEGVSAVLADLERRALIEWVAAHRK